ncbi:MAG: 3'-5' exonuclease [Marinilabiliaceae bacterium]|jgi:uncharacterized protein YprB with RNaseH-like and TPR domain|nr:3'-5' exonuclease [Marinilabiliaceae bacterium]
MKLLKDTNPSRVLFLDIETVPLVPDFESLDARLAALWDKKSSYFRKEGENASDVFERAGIYSEFGKIIAISVGLITGSLNNRAIRLKSFYGDDEVKLLQEFTVMLNNFCSGKEALLCAHNGKEFDFPYIARRMLINGLAIPSLLDNAGRKPWEINLLDTMELWKFGDYKHYTSLELITTLLGIPTPKDDIDGSMVASVYYRDNDLKRIVEYCEKDVIALVQVFLRFRGEGLVKDNNISSVTAW